MQLHNGWVRGLAIIAGGFFAILAARLIFGITGTEDQGLITTLVALMSGCFSVDLYERINKRWGSASQE